MYFVGAHLFSLTLSLSHIPTENVSSCEHVRFSFLFPSYVPMSRPLSKIINVEHTEKRFICLFCVYSSVSSRLLLPRASFSFFGWERKIYNFSTFCFLSSYNFIIAMCFALLWLNNITWIFSAIASVFLSPVLVATISCTLFTSANIFSLGLDRPFLYKMHSNSNACRIPAESSVVSLEVYSMTLAAKVATLKSQHSIC